MFLSKTKMVIMVVFSGITDVSAKDIIWGI